LDGDELEVVVGTKLGTVVGGEVGCDVGVKLGAAVGNKLVSADGDKLNAREGIGVDSTLIDSLHKRSPEFPTSPSMTPILITPSFPSNTPRKQRSKLVRVFHLVGQPDDNSCFIKKLQSPCKLVNQDPS